MKNATKKMLENLEHDVLDLMGNTMYAILDNGDRPDKRVDAIIGLHEEMKATLKRLDRITSSIQGE
tara:strand:+ start:367 stop:564 length:198 start_codon:yes stop_codon:yes gene_type:complete